MAVSAPSKGESVPMRAKLLTGRFQKAALVRLRESARRNLLLLDIVEALGKPASPSEVPGQVLGAFAGGELGGIVALRPSLVLEADLDEAALDAVLPYFETIGTGLVKSSRTGVDMLWSHFEARGKRAMIDRAEYSLGLEPAQFRPVVSPEGVLVRAAVVTDLPDLVYAARASLREEGRPDPFDGDPVGFRRWVRGRLYRARVAELGGRVAFAAYADVQRSEGWLVQGVYTWPEQRRRGLAAAGISAIAQEAFDVGASHVQLAVVDGNEAGFSVYEGLGFSAFDELRTILFV